MLQMMPFILTKENIRVLLSADTCQIPSGCFPLSGCCYSIGDSCGISFLVAVLGGIAVMGLTIARYMGADVSGYIVLAAWIALTVCGCAEQIFEWWIESRFAFRLLVSGERRKNER